jgi:hypothetical protein
MVKGVDRKLTPCAAVVLEATCSGVGGQSGLSRRWPLTWRLARRPGGRSTKPHTDYAAVRRQEDQSGCGQGNERVLVKCALSRGRRGMAQWVTVPLFTLVLANIELTGSRVQD